MTDDPTIRFAGVGHRYPGAAARTVLEGVDLVLDGPRTAFVGLNGSGKSTLARMVNGLVTPTAGSVRVHGLDPAREGRAVRRHVGFLFTDPDSQIIMPTAVEDVALSMRRRGDVPRAERAERAGRTGLALTVLGTGLLAGSLVLRAWATGRAPWGNMHEYIAALCLVGLVSWLVVVRRHDGLRHLTGIVLLPVLILLFVGGTSLYVPAGPVVPALRSYWLVVHVAAAIVGSGILLVPGAASLLYLVRRPYEEGSARLAWLARRLPDAALLDRLAYRMTIIAFPIFTFGVVCGAIWAEAAWGRYWGWDPKETVAFVMWVVLAAYLHSRATAGWRTTRAAVINVVAFALGVFNLFFVNLVVTGLHSYAGV